MLDAFEFGTMKKTRWQAKRCKILPSISMEGFLFGGCLVGGMKFFARAQQSRLFGSIIIA